MKIIKSTKNGKAILPHGLELFLPLCSTTGKKVKTYEMLEIIYQKVCLIDKFNNGEKNVESS